MDLVTSFLATVVAGLALTLPIDFRWTNGSAPLQVNLIANSQPGAIAAGAIIAVVVATFATTGLNELVAWLTALFGIVVMLVNHILGHIAGHESTLTTVNFLDSLAGGVLLGGLGAAVLHRRTAAFGWILGAISSIVIAEALPGPFRTVPVDNRHVPANWIPNDAPPVWAISVVAGLIAISAYLNRRQPPAHRLSVELPIAPIVTGLILVTTRLLTAEWIARHSDSTFAIAVAVVITVLITGIAALLLPGRDGVFVLLAAALTAAANSIVTADIPGLAVPVLVLLCAAGLLAGMRWPATQLAFISTAVLALGAVSLAYVDNTVLDTGADILAVLVAGYCLGSVTPRHTASRVLGIVILLVPSVILTLRTRLSFGTCSMSGSGHGSICDFDDRSAAPGWAALAMIAGYALFARVAGGRPDTPDGESATQQRDSPP
jgi:hypothetical protein